MNNIFDAHAHYDDKWFDEDREQLLSELPNSGVVGVVTNSVNIETSEFNRQLAEKYPYFYFTAGYHPENLENLPEDYLDKIQKYLQHPKCVALGEIGLDYHWEIPRDLQKKVFSEQIELSKKLEIPIIVHDREAHKDTMDILKEYKPKGLLHCFSGSVEMLKEVLKLDMSISLGGVVTFKNARHSIECAKYVPMDRLLLETDSPYLSPVPNRGKRNDSRNIVYIAEKIGEIKGISPQEVLDKTAKNAKIFYSVN